jgi:hypothetical protein
MFKRLHHQRIERAIGQLRLDFLRESECYFGGGTAIALLLDEYRESADIDFLCNSREGFKAVGRAVFDAGHKAICTDNARIAGELARGRDAIRIYIDPQDGGRPIKVEIINEGYLPVFSSGPTLCGATRLKKEDLIATKLLANADRGLGYEKYYRDFFDIALACFHWPQTAPSAFEKATNAYKNCAADGIKKVHTRLRENRDLLKEAFAHLGIEAPAQNIITSLLNTTPEKCIERLTNGKEGETWRRHNTPRPPASDSLSER